MFTGIIETLGAIVAKEKFSSEYTFNIQTDTNFLTNAKAGCSVALNGVCLTITSIDEAEFTVDISNETIACTTLGKLNMGDYVNLERALCVGDELNGHLLSGHVDGVGTVIAKEVIDRCLFLEIEYPDCLIKFITKKGSIAVDGVSLTVNETEKNIFEVNVIPHTIEKTLFSQINVGEKVNLEIDMIARYTARIIHRKDA